LLNKTINEITPETLVKWYNLTQYNLQTIQNKLKNANDCVWAPISQMVLSDDFIRDFKTKLDWCWISTNSPLNENFIGEFQNEVDWEAVSQFQALSEQFIRHFQDNVDWELISMNQNLSENFIRIYLNNRLECCFTVSEPFRTVYSRLPR
jgi:hypothetical protein